LEGNIPPPPRLFSAFRGLIHSMIGKADTRLNATQILAHPIMQLWKHIRNGAELKKELKVDPKIVPACVVGLGANYADAFICQDILLNFFTLPEVSNASKATGARFFITSLAPMYMAEHWAGAKEAGLIRVFEVR